MSPVSTMQELPPPLDAKDTMEHTSSYSSLMNGFGLWSSTPNDDLKKNNGSEAGTADADEEMGEEYVYEEPVVTEVAEDGTATTLKKKKKMGGFLKKLKTRASKAKQERQEKRIQKLEEKHLTADPKSCLPTLTLPTRRSYPVQITVLEGDNDHHDYEIDDLDEEEQARESKVKAQGQKIINLEWLTDQRIKDALAHDETESICSMDGVPTLPPLEGDSASTKTSNKKKKQLAALSFANKSHKRDINKIQPQFVQATKGQSALDAVRREVDAIMLEQEGASTSRGVLILEPVEEVTAPSTPQKGWSLFSSSKSKQQQPKVAQQQQQQAEESPEDDKEEEDEEALATPEQASPSKKSSGWSVFSWKSKDANDHGDKEEDEDDCSEDEDIDEESDNGSEGSYDDEYTGDDETKSRPTKITVVDTKKK